MVTIPNQNISDARLQRERVFQMLCALDFSEKQTNISLDSIREKMEELFLQPESSPDHAANTDIAQCDAAEGEPKENNCTGSCVCWCCSEKMFSRSCAEVFQVLQNLALINKIIAEHAVNWTADRMSVIDRTIIRLAVYEGVVAKTVPIAAAINEAVELAKVYGSSDSGRFVHGVLGRIVREKQ